MKKFWADFKKFIMRGNVIDMAVGVAVASAFTAIVTAFTKGFISPLLALLTGDSDLDAMTVTLRPAVTEIVDGVETIVTPAVELLWGTFVQKIIDFLIIAFVLFLVMRIASAVMAHSAKIRQNMINVITHEDEKALEAEAAAKAAEEEAKALEAAAKAAEEEAKAQALEAERRAIEEEKQRLARQEALLTEIRDLLKTKQ